MKHLLHQIQEMKIQMIKYLKLPAQKVQLQPKIHSLFVKVPPKQTAKFERMVRRNRTLEHEVKLYHELLRDLQNFIHERLPKNPIKLNIPNLYHGFTDLEEKEKNSTGSYAI